VRPTIATVAVFTIIPIWNDLWFPLILTSSDSTHTITLGVQQFLGQHITTRCSLPRIRTASNLFSSRPEIGYFNRKTAGLDTGGRCAIKTRLGSVNIRDKFTY
jgi:ABC-type glycerol-3-phosphate transport system permease component